MRLNQTLWRRQRPQCQKYACVLGSSVLAGVNCVLFEKSKIVSRFLRTLSDEMPGGEDETATGGPQLDRSEPSPLHHAGNTAEMLSVAGQPPIVSLLITLKRERLDLQGSPFF